MVGEESNTEQPKQLVGNEVTSSKCECQTVRPTGRRRRHEPMVRLVDRWRNTNAKWCDHLHDNPTIQICRTDNRIYECNDEESKAKFIRNDILVNFISCRAVYVYLEFVHICKKNEIPVLSTGRCSKMWRVLSTILSRTLENMENNGKIWRP